MKNGLFNETGYKKQILIVGILLIAIVLFIIFIFILNLDKGYLIIDESCILRKSGNKYRQVNSINDDIFDGKYDVVSDLKIYNDVTLQYNSNKWYYFDDNYNDLSLSKVSAAYTKEFEGLKVADYSSAYYDSSDDEYLKKVLDNNNYSDYFVIKSSYDLDDDGILETIYTVTNEGLESGGSYSSIFLVKGNVFIGRLDNDTSKPYLVKKIIDLDGDDKYEVIVSKGTVDVATFDTCYQIYSISGKKIKMIKGC